MYYNETDIKNRRNFLKSLLVGGGFSMNLLKSSSLATAMLMSRRASAMTGISRVVMVFIPGGAPRDAGNSLYIPRNANLGTLPETSAPLEPFKNQMCFFNGAQITNFQREQVRGHQNTSKALGGLGRRNTYDVELERAIGGNSPFPALYLGTQSRSGAGLSRRDNRENNVFQDNPIAAYDRVFGGNNTSGGNNNEQNQREQSLIDTQREEIRALRRLLGADERARLDEHLEALDSIERRLQSTQTASADCSNPSFNTNNFRFDRNNLDFNTECDLQSDLATLALSCNMTKVITLSMGFQGCRFTIPGLNFKGTYHESIHGANRKRNFSETRTQLSRRFAYLLRGLRDTNDEQGNSLLDSTLVVQVTDMGNGSGHTAVEAPVTLTGGGSKIRSGRLYSTNFQQNVLDTVTEALGVDVPQLGTGAVNNVVV